MLQKVTHIEGLESTQYENIDLTDDTRPDATIVTFETRSEEMPFLSNQEGREVKKPFVWIKKISNLGNSVVYRRIRDKVELDSESKKWKIVRLVPGTTSEGVPLSDIKRYAVEWNAFMRGLSYEEIGTPVGLLFKADPTRADWYKSKHIHTVEQLAALSETHIQELGMGVRADVVRARGHLEKAQAVAASAHINNAFEEKDRQIEALRRQLGEVLSRLEEVSSGQAIQKVKRTRKKKEEVEA